MPFLKYQHIEKLGTAETRDIEYGECFVFPKIDGTNSSVWLEDGVIHCGSRNRELSLENDNAGFMAWAINQKRIHGYLLSNPTHILYGEWLVPHSLKTYRENAWRDFYVFDVYDLKEDIYVSFKAYEGALKSFGINYIPPIAIVNNATYAKFIEFLDKNVFLIQDGKGVGEGIVIKRYGYKNKFGRTVWAKVVTSEFKERHAKEMGAPVVECKKIIEQEIAESFVTLAIIEKEYSKICLEKEWNSKLIPMLLNVVYYSVIKEEIWEILKSIKQKVIDFDRLKHFVFAEVRKKKPDLF